MNKIIITGANGFLGSHLVDVFQKDCQVLALDKYSRSPQHKINNNVTLHKIDLLHTKTLEKIFEKASGAYVFEFFSSNTPASSFLHPINEISHVSCFLERLKLYKKYEMKRIFFPSSAGTIYKIKKEKKYYQETDEIDPNSPYALSKYVCEKYLQFFHKAHGLDYIVLRISSVYGERQNFLKDQGVISVFLYQILMRGRIKVFGSLKNERDFIYVDDLVDFISKIYSQEHSFNIYNVGSGDLLSLDKILDIIRQKTGIDYKVTQTGLRSCDNKKIGVNLGRIVQEFNFSPSVSIDEGISKTFEYIKSKMKNNL